MSNQHKSTASRPWLAKKVWKLPTALMVALMALLAMATTSVFAQETIIRVDKQTPVEAVAGSTVTVDVTVVNVAASSLQITSLTDAACSSLTLKAGEDANNNGLLDEPDWVYSCVMNVGSTGFNNFVTVQALNAGTPVSDSDIEPVTVLNRGINVKKTGTSPINQGANAVFNIEVKNTGLANIDANVAGNYAVSDALCNGGPVRGADNPGNGDNILAADPDGSITDGDVNGEVWTYTCTVPNAISDKVINTVVVTAKDTTGASYTHNASATIEVLNPGLNITKVPSKSAAVVGESVTWTITVYNTGETNLGAPTVTDNQCAPVNYVRGDPNGAGVALEPGEQWIYNCSRTYGAAGSVTNIASVTAGAESAQTSATISIVQPGIQIEKSPFIQYVRKGNNATFTVKVTNTGGGNLSNVVVEDLICNNAVSGKLPLVSGDVNSDGLLNPDNAATPQNDAEVWNYTCTVNNVQADDVNVATVTAKDISNNTVAKTATASIKMINPTINIVKTLTNVSLLKGQNANFQLTVTNAGNAELSNLVVTDAQCNAAPVYNAGLSTDVDSDGRLDPGDTFVYTCSKNNVQSEFINIASVTALQANINQTVQDDDTLPVNVLTPGILLEKTPAYQIIQEGQVYSWTLNIKNTGLANLNPTPGLIDPLCAGGPSRQPDVPPGNNDAVLNAGETWVYYCFGPALLTFTQDEIINTALVQFTDGNGNVVNDIERATVQVVRNFLDLEKTANASVIVAGGSVQFTFQVRNFSTQDMSNVAVADSQCPGGTATYNSGDTNGDNKLNPTETWVYSCTVSGKTADFTNIASATAKLPNGGTVSDLDYVSVQVLNAKLDVDKTTTTPVVQQGGSANFTVQVKNTGTLQLKEVVVTDDKCTLSAPTGDSNLNGFLDAGETWTYTCTVTNVQSSFRNTANVTAKEAGTNLAVSGSDFVDVNVIRPGINLDKIANSNSVAQGGSASFTILVSNAGSTNLSNVVPVDANCTLVPLSNGNGDAILNVGETWVYSCTVSNVQGANGSYTNTASVTATDTNGVPVSAQDSASVTVTTTPPPPPPPSGGLVLAQTVNPTTINKGGSATFQVSLSNGTANTVAISSFKGSKCKSFTRLADNPGDNDSSLESGETWVWSCVLSNIKKSTTNKVTVKIASPKQTLTASATVSVLSARGILIELDPNEVIEADPVDESEREVIDEEEGAEVIDESLLVNKAFMPIAAK